MLAIYLNKALLNSLIHGVSRLKWLEKGKWDVIRITYCYIWISGTFDRHFSWRRNDFDYCWFPCLSSLPVTAMGHCCGISWNFCRRSAFLPSWTNQGKCFPEKKTTLGAKGTEGPQSSGALPQVDYYRLSFSLRISEHNALCYWNERFFSQTFFLAKCSWGAGVGILNSFWRLFFGSDLAIFFGSSQKIRITHHFGNCNYWYYYLDILFYKM